ncbi:MAG: UDP-N-acetylglucosamine 2-epimerase [Pirellulaceae bacterium]|nr:UDP-N-acetylglucosamine 2-epimerase [Pirellulaceae bacterium]
MNQQVPISVFLGTKAQLIKMAPVIAELDRRDWSYQLLDTGQHAGLIPEIMQQFEIRQPDLRMYGDLQSGVSTLTGGLRWIASLAQRYLPNAAYVRRELFHDQTGICLVHGDTMSTLLATLIARRGGQKVAHVEAGLRSWRWFDPFPEELVRVWVMRLAHYLFAPSEVAQQNLERMALDTRMYRLPGNTAWDTVARDLQRTPTALPKLPEGYAVVTVHRLETIYRRRNLQRVMKIILAANQRRPVVFVQHHPTMHRLRAYGMESALNAAGVQQIPLMDHVSFLHLLKGAAFVLTDGGSIQEEVSYLGVPCLLLRRSAERDEGLGANVLLSKLCVETSSSFLDTFDDHRQPPQLELSSGNAASPSAALVDHLQAIGQSLLAGL